MSHRLMYLVVFNDVQLQNDCLNVIFNHNILFDILIQPVLIYLKQKRKNTNQLRTELNLR